MNDARRWKPSPSMTVALTAVFIALAGTAWAAGLEKNSVRSKQIKDGQVLTQDLGDGSVAGVKLAADAVDASKVGADELGGADVDEATLVGVDAATFGGVGPGGFALAGHSHDSTYVNEGQSDSVTAAMIPDAPRAMQIPLRSFIDCDEDAGTDINFNSGLDGLPDFANSSVDGEGFRLRFDATLNFEDQNSSICSQVAVPPDAIANSPLALWVRASTDGVNGDPETISCAFAVNGGSISGTGSVTTSTAGSHAYLCSAPLTYGVHDSISVSIQITSTGVSDNLVDLSAVELEYLATG